MSSKRIKIINADKETWQRFRNRYPLLSDSKRTIQIEKDMINMENKIRKSIPMEKLNKVMEEMIHGKRKKRH